MAWHYCYSLNARARAALNKHMHSASFFTHSNTLHAYSNAIARRKCVLQRYNIHIWMICTCVYVGGCSGVHQGTYIYPTLQNRTSYDAKNHPQLCTAVRIIVTALKAPVNVIWRRDAYTRHSYLSYLSQSTSATTIKLTYDLMLSQLSRRRASSCRRTYVPYIHTHIHFAPFERSHSHVCCSSAAARERGTVRERDQKKHK